ncbi:MAG: hypothetical protein ACHQK9_11510 [Reyranellales bacterium]
MDRDTDLFVQAFWVKCHETIRPEIDSAVGDLRSAGHDVGISTQEYSSVADRLPAEIGPSLTLSLRPKGMADGAVHPTLQFHADVARKAVDVRTSAGKSCSYDLATLGTTEVKTEIDEWLSKLISASPT